ncbi:MAG: hypothetical protein E6G30_00345 [Actinobacteria bacterium]|nr:MAG: hypothetical protein E6G30_00345 [Actinomycetota bacterium]
MASVARPLAALAGALALAAAGCGGGGGSKTHAAATTASRPVAPPFGATLTAPGHNPRADRPWPVVVTATANDGRPLPAVVHYQFLFAGRVVAERSTYRFRGRFRDVVTWPRRSIGIPLTFRAAITTKLGKRNLDYPVTVRP